MNQVQFNANETLLVLRSNPSIFMSLGVEKLVNVDGRGLMMKVNGHHHKGRVLITLGWDDWYRVHILSQFGEVLDSYDGVIDDRIERIEEYEW
jgi:hypothetical protein